jgi:hypothetical protein
MISELIGKFKGLWYGEQNKEVEGYLIMTDSTSNKTLLLVKDGEKSWKTKWFNNNQNTFKAPSQHLGTVFNNHK